MNTENLHKLLTKEILFFGKRCILICDGKCQKAWGINSRPTARGFWKTDEELPDAPDCPGTFEGGCGKPLKASVDNMNKWCARECERSCIYDPEKDGEINQFLKIHLTDFRKRMIPDK